MAKVLITGASSGIGKELALVYAKQGFEVIACGRNTDRLQSLAAEHERIATLAFDITDKDQVKAAIGEFNDLDIVILNAGDCQYIDDAKHFDATLFEWQIKTNLISVAYCLEAVLPNLAAGRQLVIVSSSAQFLPLPRAEAYGASKAGLSYLTNVLRLDLPHLTVTLVHPGFVETPLTDKNTFSMPLKITAQNAAQRIYDGVLAKKLEINFPKRFIFFLKLASWIPIRVWLAVIKSKRSA